MLRSNRASISLDCQIGNTSLASIDFVSSAVGASGSGRRMKGRLQNDVAAPKLSAPDRAYFAGSGSALVRCRLLVAGVGPVRLPATDFHRLFFAQARCLGLVLSNDGQQNFSHLVLPLRRQAAGLFDGAVEQFGHGLIVSLISALAKFYPSNTAFNPSTASGLTNEAKSPGSWPV